MVLIMEHHRQLFPVGFLQGFFYRPGMLRLSPGFLGDCAHTLVHGKLFKLVYLWGRLSLDHLPHLPSFCQSCISYTSPFEYFQLLFDINT